MTIVYGESKVILFIALDQNGKAITKFSELDGIVTFMRTTFQKNFNGTASLISNKAYFSVLFM